MNTSPSEETFSCVECQAGHMHRRYITLFTYIGDELITVPDFPAWVCDVCKRREYDDSALNRLSLILSPNAGRATTHRRSVKNTPVTRTKRPRPSRPE